MRHLGVLAALFLATGADEAAAQSERARETERALAAAERALERWTARELIPFRDEADFAAYIRAVDRAQEARWARRNADRVQWAEAQTGSVQQPPEPVCSPEDKQCRIRSEQASEGALISVTGTRIQAAPLTNNQEQGVDEGDVVKQIGHYLLVLQDGRIFVVDMEGGPSRDRLVLVDRANVYRHPNEQAWYDELTVHGDRVIVTGFSYDLDASEIAVFRLGEGGRLTRDGVFQIKSADYYDRNNYSTRVVGDRLVLYTPLPVDELNADAIQWPRLRRVPLPDGPREEAEEDSAAAFRSGAQLLTPSRLHRPLATLTEPTIHMITTCALGETAPATGLGCESRGFVGSRARQFYVPGEQAFLWTFATDSDDFPEDPEPCAPGLRPRRSQTDRAIVYRLGLASGDAGVVGASGGPFDQLGLDASNGRFRALLSWYSMQCLSYKDSPLVYFSIEESAFGRRLREAPDRAFTPMPDIEATSIENRFTDRFLVFGGRIQLDAWSDEPGENGIAGPGRAVVVPNDRPQEATILDLPHRVWRAERVGDNAVLTGHSDSRGLELSVIDLRGRTPRVASSVQLEGRFESEGRSHAFNSSVGAEGAGLIGLPTVLRIGESDRYHWRTTPSDLSFLSIDAAGQLQSLGALEAQAASDDGWNYDRESDDPRVYSCQVSCIDWYGNSRPLFSGGRVFGLTATELVEGRVEGGRIGEVQRIDLTKAELPPHLSRPAVTAPAAGGEE